MSVTVEEEEKNEVAIIINNVKVSQATREILLKEYQPFYEKLEEWKEHAMSIVVDSEEDSEKMKMAREVRITIKNNRVAAKKLKEDLKRESLEYGKAVQSCYNMIENTCKELESYLQNQEDYAIIQQQKREQELHDSRVATIEEKGLSHYQIEGQVVGMMSEDDFEMYLDMLQGKKDHYEEEERKKEEAKRLQLLKIERESKLGPYWQFVPKERPSFETLSDSEWNDFLEEMKSAKSKFDEEQASIKAENDRLKKEQEEKDRLAEEERRKVGEKHRQELAAAAQKAREEEKAKQATSPTPQLNFDQGKSDKESLLELSKFIDGMPYPSVTSKEGRKILFGANNLMNKVSKYIKEGAEKL